MNVNSSVFSMDYYANIDLDNFTNISTNEVNPFSTEMPKRQSSDFRSIQFKKWLDEYFFAKQEPVLYEPPTSVVIVLYMLYATICFLALVGNLTVLWLILGSKQMWTVTNMFISNLAVADVIMAIFIIPFHFQAALFQRWDMPEFLCPVCPFVQILSVTVSVFTLSIIAVHRYQGIMHLFKPPMKKQTAAWIILGMWIICAIIALPTLLDYQIMHYRYKDGTIVNFCHNTWLHPKVRAYYNQITVILQYFLPLIIITVAYARMGRALWQNETPGNEERSRDELILKNKRKVTKIMVIVVAMFGACWLPFQLYNFLLTIFPSINNFSYINMIWFSIHWLAMSNSCCNPVIYGIYNERFRSEFRKRCPFVQWYISRSEQQVGNGNELTDSTRNPGY